MAKTFRVFLLPGAWKFAEHLSRSDARLHRETFAVRRAVKAARRRQRIIVKQVWRDYYRSQRRPALIHNGRKPR